MEYRASSWELFSGRGFHFHLLDEQAIEIDSPFYVLRRTNLSGQTTRYESTLQ